jgi:hypothetical protein
MRSPVVRGALIAMTLASIGGVARAQADLPGARALGMGEAMRAIATGAEGPLLNPAGMSLVRQYVVEGMYGFRVEDLGHHAFVAVVDSVTSRVAAGLYYGFIYTNPKLGFDWAGGRVDNATFTRTGHVAGLSLSIPLGDKFIVGATIKYLHFSTTAPLPQGAVPSTLTTDSVNGISFDVGLLLHLGDKFNIGLVGQNLWDHGSKESPLSLGIGLAYMPLPVFTISFDTLVNFTGYTNIAIDPMTDQVNTTRRIAARLGPGLEFVAAKKVPIRAGVVYDSGLPATFVTMGLGYLSPQFGIDLSYRVKVQSGLENFLMLGLRLFVD